MDRLYVNDASGERVGWLDLTTGERTMSQVGRTAAFDRTVSEWAIKRSLALPPSRPVGDSADRQAVSVRASDAVADGQQSSRPEPRAAAVALIEPGGGDGFRPLPAEDLVSNVPGARLRANAEAAHRQRQRSSWLTRLLSGDLDERAWRKGEEGEVLVAKQLRKLGPSWRVLHSIPIGDNGADIDHLVIGPGGVFSLNAKHHDGKSIWVAGETFMVDGHRQPYVRNSRFEAERVSKFLTRVAGFAVPARGVIVPVRAGSLTVKEPPSDVSVVSRRRIARYLRSQPKILDELRVETLFSCARRRSTWAHQ
jgi:hypothetical protein